MTDLFFEKPVLNSPYAYPGRHWELDASGQPTQKIVEARRKAEFITPIPKPKKRGGQGEQASLILEFGDVWQMDSDFKAKVAAEFQRMIEGCIS